MRFSSQQGKLVDPVTDSANVANMSELGDQPVLIASHTMAVQQTNRSSRSSRKAMTLYSFWKRHLPKPVKKGAMVAWYNLLSTTKASEDLLFLNHGFARPGADPNTVHLESHDEKNRYFIQLYHDATKYTELAGREVLEVSSGRGGGMDWLLRRYSPKSFTGLDIAKMSTKFCRSKYSDSRLMFESGDAGEMPFGDSQFDIVINIESSLNYDNLDAFLCEVDRVLRPGGRFVFADYRRRARICQLKRSLFAMGYDVLRMEDITESIAAGLRHTERQKRRLVDQHVPFFIRGVARKFAGVDNATNGERELFQSGQKRYLAMTLEKPLRPHSALPL